MADLNEKIREEIDELRGMRDELQVRIHLAKLEAKERWQKTEKDWEHLEGRLKVLANEGREAADNVAEALKLTAREIREGYRHIRDLL